MARRRLTCRSILVALILVPGLVASASTATSDIVLHASDIAVVHGAWVKGATTDGAGSLVATTNAGWATTESPLSAPTDFLEATFTASAATPYRVWLRLRAADNSKYNDSVWVQFSDAVDGDGAAVYRVGSASGLLVNLENCYACGVSGWGWQDKAYWRNQLSTVRFAASGTHTIRIQTREDGVQVDQIVLSASTYLTSAPGPVANDATIVAKPGSGPGISAATPFHGSPASVPGSIRAQDFDNGGEGIAYHDTTPGNAGGAYRSTDVDLEPSTDGGHDVGWLSAGEWLNYTVSVGAASEYAVTFRVASLGPGGTFHLEADGTNVSGAMTIPDTGGWQNWHSVTTTATLGAGQQSVRLVMETGGPAGPVGNINAIHFEAVPAAPIDRPTAAPTPYTGTAMAVPGRIAAGDFDHGGEGVAYHDTVSGNAGGAHRETGVDLEPSADGGHNIGWIAAGEWLNYTIDVASAGTYTAQLRVASPGGGGSLHLGFNSASNVWEAVAIPATGGWQIWTTVNVPLRLASGRQLMTLSFDTGGFNVASVSLVREAPPASQPVLPAVPTTAVLDGAVWMTVTPTLSWRAAGATSYEVRLGTATPPATYAANLSASYYGPSALAFSTKYYWQVVAKNAAGSTAGPVWSFTTEGSAPTAPPPVPTASSTIRMLTWNIHHGYTASGAYDPWAQAQFIVKQNPDVVALQEVQTWNENQPARFQSMLEQLTGQRWSMVWAPAINSSATEGNLLLTRLPLVSSSYQQLHATSDWTAMYANRSVAQMTVSVGGVAVNVFSTHLDYYNTTHRTIQETQLMAWLWNFSGARLVGGDFNSWWGEYWITNMESQHTDTWRDVTGLRDGGYTVNQSVRFDYIFRAFDSNWRAAPTNCYVPVTYLSDHNPVVADFKVQ